MVAIIIYTSNKKVKLDTGRTCNLLKCLGVNALANVATVPHRYHPTHFIDDRRIRRDALLVCVSRSRGNYAVG